MFFLRFFIILIFLINCISLSSTQFSKDVILKVIDKENNVVTEVETEIADTERKRQIGLMFRKEMKFQQGMLFVFDWEEPRSFWMKNTYIALDIIFCDANLNIVEIKKDAKPLSEKSIQCSQPAKYVLEVKSGFVDFYGLEMGYRLEF